MALTDLLDQLEGQITEHLRFKDRERLYKRIDKMTYQLCDLMAEYDPAHLDSGSCALGALDCLTRPTPVDVAEVRELLHNAIESAGVIGAGQDVIDRAHQLLSRLDAPMNFKVTSIRGIGQPITVQCDCGFSSISNTGDWTSIRWQAKRHAKDCETADPHEGFVNDLDEARKSVVLLRQNYRTGGLEFSL